MWTYFFGPLFAIFPVRWRASLPFATKVQWERATAISGLGEAVLGMVSMMYWYSYAMSMWVGNGVNTALTGKMGPGVQPQYIGGAALLLWWMHPVTWLVAYFGLEGAVRLCVGAFAGNSCGIFPLYLADKIVTSLFRRGKPIGSDVTNAGGNISSVADAVRERMRAARLPEVPDELYFTKNESGEELEIRASRRKLDWTPPRTVRYLDSYYRLEEDSSADGARPFRYRLRRLAAGVPGRTVLLYSPPDAVIHNVGAC